MERIREEMVKMSQDERERYLYLREAMAESDRASQLESAERRGIQRGEILTKITLIQKKMQRGDSVEKIAEDLLEETSFVKIIYEIVRKNTEVSADLIASECGKRVSDVNSLVSIMEIKGFLITSMGKISIAK